MRGKGLVNCPYRSRSAGIYDITTKSITHPNYSTQQLLSARASVLDNSTLLVHNHGYTSTAISETAKSLGYSLKPEQRRCLQIFVGGNDVFVSLPTGYGKS